MLLSHKVKTKILRNLSRVLLMRLTSMFAGFTGLGKKIAGRKSSKLTPVLVNELTARDAHQSLLATRMRIDDVLETVRLNAKSGFNTLECWGGATYDVGVRFLDENPWDNLRAIKKVALESAAEAGVKAPNLMMLMRGQTAIGYKNYPDDVIRAFVRQAAENGMNVFRLFDGLNDMRNLATAMDEVKKCQADGLDVEAQGTICYTTGPEGEAANDKMTTLERQKIFNLDYYVGKARELKEMGADSICVKDMAGLMNPDVAKQLVPAIQKETGLSVVLHMHAGMGKSDATLLAAIDAGVDQIDVGNAGLASGSGHTSIQMIKNMIKRSKKKSLQGRMPEIDDKPVSDLRKFLLYVRPKYRKWETAYNPDVQQKIFTAQIPGGMLSNFENQIKGQITKMDISYDEVLAKVLDEVPRVREDFGWPPLVTPASQIVGTQAVQNVLAELRGQKKYSIVSNESAALILGELGATPVEPKAHVIEAAEDATKRKRITHRPADDLEDGLPSARDQMTANALDASNLEDVLTAAIWKHGVDSLLARKAGKVLATNEPKPELPSHMQKHSQRDFGFELYDLHESMGVHVLEALCQTVKELKRIEAGFFQGLPEAELAYRAERYRAYIQDRKDEIISVFAKSDLSAVNLDWFFKSAPAEFNLNSILRERCLELGAGGANDNVPHINVADITQERKRLASLQQHSVQADAPAMVS